MARFSKQTISMQRFDWYYFDIIIIQILRIALVAEEALSDPQVGMIIAYHPPIFRPISHLTHADEKQSILLKCIHNNVSVYSPHTALDAVNGGGTFDRRSL